MTKIIVADTGPLIALAMTHVLPHMPIIFKKVIVPDQVFEEALINIDKPGARMILEAQQKKWILTQSVEVSSTFSPLIELLDLGEAAALTLAKQLEVGVLMDERKGRKVATHLHVPVLGTAAVLIRAKQLQLVPEIKPLLEKLISHGYRFSTQLISEVLRHCNES